MLKEDFELIFNLKNVYLINLNNCSTFSIMVTYLLSFHVRTFKHLEVRNHHSTHSKRHLSWQLSVSLHKFPTS